MRASVARKAIRLILQQAIHAVRLSSSRQRTRARGVVVETMLRLQSAIPDADELRLWWLNLAGEPDLTAWLSQHRDQHAPTAPGVFWLCLPKFSRNRTFLSYVRSLMRSGDMLLLSANLSPGLYADAIARILGPQV